MLSAVYCVAETQHSALLNVVVYMWTSLVKLPLRRTRRKRISLIISGGVIERGMWC